MKCLRMIGLALAAVCFAAQADAEELSGTLRKIRETGVINIGYRDSSIPFSYLDDNRKPIGFAIDICLRIVEAVKKELKLDKLTVEFNPVTSSTRIPLLANGTIDLECGSTTNNPDRLKQVAFTNTHFLTATRFISKKSSKLNSIEDLKGKSVASTSGTTNIKQLTEANAARNLGINIIPAKEHAESFLLVETDRAVAACWMTSCLQALPPVRRTRAPTSSPRMRFRNRSLTASCCARTIRLSRKLPMMLPRRFIGARKAKGSMTSGSCRRSRPRG